MRVTLHSTLAISTCALALLSRISSVYPYGGVFKEGDNTATTFAQRYVMEHQKKLGLSKIQWSSRYKKTLSLARVTWDKQDAIMKCAIVSVSGPIRDPEINMFEVTAKEVIAFNELAEAKERLKGAYVTGRQNVMDPLYRFSFSEKQRIRYFCHLYSYIDGETLEDYFKKQTVSQAYITAAKILPDIVRGLIYLYNAGIIHDDMFPKNVMLQLDSDRRIIGVKIIDLDATKVFKNGRGSTLINLDDEENLSPNPRQRYESCNGLKGAIAVFLKVFVSLNGGKNPFTPNYVLTEQVARSYLERFKQSSRYAKLEIGNVEAAIPAIHSLLKAMHTLEFDRFTCSSPILASRGLPPRTL